MTIMLRGKTYYLRKRVPTRYRNVDDRGMVWISLHTDSRTVAESKADRAWAQMIEAWEARRAGDTEDAEERYAAAQEIAKIRGFRYLDVQQVAKLPLEPLLDRVEAIDAPNCRPNLVEAAALLGTVPEPPITVSTALELYWTLTADEIIGKSEDQLRRWENPRKKAVKNFIDVVGDKALAEITADDMLDFRQWWLEKMQSEGLTANSANKDLIHLGDVLKTVNKLKRLGLELPLTDLAFKEGEAKQTSAFSPDWIRNRLLKPGALDRLNAEARGIFLTMVNTGARPSELAGLSANTIKLDGKVPHISIEPEFRQLKTPNARRVIPLCGVSLDAIRQFPEGFGRYRTNSASLSGTINKFLRENGLLETSDHSLYSLRHSFEDRMLEAGVDERIRRDLMGHRLGRERYGKGASLEHLAESLRPLAF